MPKIKILKSEEKDTISTTKAVDIIFREDGKDDSVLIETEVVFRFGLYEDHRILGIYGIDPDKDQYVIEDEKAKRHLGKIADTLIKRKYKTHARSAVKSDSKPWQEQLARNRQLVAVKNYLNTVAPELYVWLESLGPGTDLFLIESGYFRERLLNNDNPKDIVSDLKDLYDDLKQSVKRVISDEDYDDVDIPELSEMVLRSAILKDLVSLGSARVLDRVVKDKEFEKMMTVSIGRTSIADMR